MYAGGMLGFSSGSFGLNFDLTGCAEVVTIVASAVREMRMFVIEAVDDFIW